MLSVTVTGGNNRVQCDNDNCDSYVILSDKCYAPDRTVRKIIRERFGWSYVNKEDLCSKCSKNKIKEEK